MFKLGFLSLEANLFPMLWFEFLRIALVVSFVCCSTSLLIITVIRRMQVKDIVRAGRRFIPSRTLVSILLVSTPVILVLCSPSIAASFSLPLMVFYGIGAVAWLISSYMNESIIITRTGLIFPWGHFRQRIGWGQVTDFFVSKTVSGMRVVLLWKCDEGNLCRYELAVPSYMVEWIERAIETRGTMKDKRSIADRVRTV